MSELRPLVKTVGGKSRLAATIVSLFPRGIDVYVEPFVGGGAVFIEAREQFATRAQVFLADANPTTIELLEACRDQPTQLVHDLESASREYEADPQATFLRVRREWNEGVRSPARFVLLKQSGFNGLWRENAAGHHNVAWGKHLTPRFPDHDDVMAWSEALRGVHLSAARAHETLSELLRQPDSFFQKQNVVVYLDPPYLGTFTGYTHLGWTVGDQLRLARACRALHKRHASVLMSTSVYGSSLVAFCWPEATRVPLTTRYVVSRQASDRTTLTSEVLFSGAHEW